MCMTQFSYVFSTGWVVRLCRRSMEGCASGPKGRKKHPEGPLCFTRRRRVKNFLTPFLTPFFYSNFFDFSRVVPFFQISDWGSHMYAWSPLMFKVKKSEKFEINLFLF